MKTYRQFRPTSRDCAGLGLPDQQDWLVVPIYQNRDSQVLERSNFQSAMAILEEKDRGEDVEVHRFGHWGPGWFEIILVRPGSPAAQEAQCLEDALANYCILNEDNFNQLAREEADLIWKSCYTDQERVQYLREKGHRAENWLDLLKSVRGKFFPGDVKDLV